MQIESNFVEVSDCFPKITKWFVFMFAGSPIDDFSKAARTDRRLSLTMLHLCCSTGERLLRDLRQHQRRIHLGHGIHRMGALCFVHAIQSEAFSSSSLAPVVIPRTVKILGLSCFGNCQSLPSISIEFASFLRQIESEAFSLSFLISIVIPRTIDIVFASAFGNDQRFSVLIGEGSDHLPVDGLFLAEFWLLDSILIFWTFRMRGKVLEFSGPALSKIEESRLEMRF
jgi:hypothetical protein